MDSRSVRFLKFLKQKKESAAASSANLKHRLLPKLFQRPQPDVESGSAPPAPPPPPPPWNLFSGILVTLCFTSAFESLLLFLQLESEHKHVHYFPLSFHLFSLAVAFAFATTFLEKFVVPSGSDRLADMLGKIGKGFFGAAFFIAIVIPAPMWLRFVDAAIFLVGFIAVVKYALT